MIGLIFLKINYSTRLLKIIKILNNSHIIKKELKEISQFCKLKTNGLLDPSIDTKPISYDFDYDILDWIDNYEIDSDLGKYVFGKKEKIYI